MAADGQIVFEITADGKKAIADIKDVTKAIQQETKKWDDSVDSSANNMSGAMAHALDINRIKDWGIQAAKALFEFGKEAVNAASDLQEVQNVVDVTFGASASAIDEWARKAGTQFGLTETQAKKFTSTLGAMAKSSGVSSGEIVEMSTDLAGLAADMASFYNLDFETAFEKIRSGISGETEPLKQLGINMSVANLEAYALSQGISKAFSDMSQGEQTMLRYQYLMQATSDAQGDFARTSDGYANSMRTLETNIERIKTALGNTFLETVSGAVTELNGFLELLIPEEKKDTIIDSFNQIDVDTETKLADIEKVSQEAQALIDRLGLISGTDAGEAIKKLAEGANTLDSSSPSNWSAILGSLTSIDGLNNVFDNSSAGTNIESLANALSGASVDTDKAEAWKTFLGALSSNADAVSNLTGTSVEETKKWLEGLSEAINSIEPGDAEAWDKLLGTLMKGFATDTPEGQQFIEGLATQFLALGSDSEAAVAGLTALGFTSEQIEEKQAEWLKTMKQLSQTIPGMNDIINEQTGAIEGGTEALQKNLNEWKANEEKKLVWAAYYAKEKILLEKKAQRYSLELDVIAAQSRSKKAREALANVYGVEFDPNNHNAVVETPTFENNEQREKWLADQEHYYLLLMEEADAVDTLTAYTNDYTEAEERQAETKQALIDKYGEEVDASKAAGNAAQDAGQKVSDAWRESATAVQDSIKALADYVESVHDATQQTVDGVISGFESVTRGTIELKNKRDELIQKQAKLNKETDEYKELEKQIKELNDQIEPYSADSMKSGLEDQKGFMEEYLSNLEKAKKMGLSDELLASLSDGSVESAEYLASLVDPVNAALAGEVDKLYQEVQEQKAGFVDALAQQKLAADETYDALVAKAKESIAQLNLASEAETALKDTVGGIASGINSEVPAVASAVNAIIAELTRLTGYGINLDLGASGNIPIVKPNSGSFVPMHSQAKGLDYVPFSGYLAQLHEGEAILTAEENRIWQNFRNGGASMRNVDYDALGGVMRDNVKAGGDVYLDGRTVGHVISAQQATSYRNLQRSGWQA